MNGLARPPGEGFGKNVDRPKLKLDFEGPGDRKYVRFTHPPFDGMRRKAISPLAHGQRTSWPGQLGITFHQGLG